MKNLKVIGLLLGSFTLASCGLFGHIEDTNGPDDTTCTSFTENQIITTTNSVMTVAVGSLDGDGSKENPLFINCQKFSGISLVYDPSICNVLTFVPYKEVKFAFEGGNFQVYIVDWNSQTLEEKTGWVKGDNKYSLEFSVDFAHDSGKLIKMVGESATNIEVSVTTPTK